MSEARGPGDRFDKSARIIGVGTRGPDIPLDVPVRVASLGRVTAPDRRRFSLLCALRRLPRSAGYATLPRTPTVPPGALRARETGKNGGMKEARTQIG